MNAAIQAANHAVYQQSRQLRQYNGMGTTLVAAHISDQGLRWVSVGDSLLMLYRAGSLKRLNEDHSLRALDAQARGGAAANMLTSALMGADIHKADLHIKPVAIEQGDLVIVASDGVLSLPDEQIADILASVQPAEVDAMTEALIEQVHLKDMPRQDNCTIAMFAPGAPRRASARRALRWVAWLGFVVALAAAAAVAARYYQF